MMKKTMLLFLLVGIVTYSGYTQDEFITVNDFEEAIGQITGWVNFADFSAPGEPAHSGESSMMLDITHEGGWGSAIYTFPEPFDGREADEFRMWVYSDFPFRLRVDLEVEIVMGVRVYSPDDVGTWKEFVFWISEEQSKLWEESLEQADQLRFWINPDSATVDGYTYPSGFDGVVFVDDMQIRQRKPVEREYHTLVGFNDSADEDLVTLASGTYFGVLESDDPPPTEGDGFLMFEYTSSWSENFTVNLRDFPEILEYDRIHADVMIDESGGWASFSLLLRCSWTDEDGNGRGTGWTALSENILNHARGEEWENVSGQYGPVDSEGFALNWLYDEISGVFDDPEGTISLTFITQGAGNYDFALAYLDNLSLSRPVGSSVSSWELY